MEREALALKTVGRGAIAVIGVFTVLFLIVASEYRSVTDVVALILLVGIPTAVLVDAVRSDLRELRSSGG